MRNWLRRRKGADTQPATGLRVASGFLTDPGCRREINEDSGCVLRPQDASLAGKGLLAVVADGMGGHQSGEVASKIAVDVVSRVYYASSEDPQAALLNAVREANRAVWSRSREGERHAGMGTTCTALAVRDGLAYAAHVGDSRIYLVRGGRIFQMTEDHSLVMEMVRNGLLTAAQASRHEDRNVIVRALGTKADIEASTWSEPFPIRAGDRFVLCSDGLYDLVSEDEMRNVVSAAEPQTACMLLVRAARHRGGHDNITAAVLSFLEAGAGEAESAVRETRESEIPT